MTSFLVTPFLKLLGLYFNVNCPKIRVDDPILEEIVVSAIYEFVTALYRIPVGVPVYYLYLVDDIRKELESAGYNIGNLSEEGLASLSKVDLMLRYPGLVEVLNGVIDVEAFVGEARSVSFDYLSPVYTLEGLLALTTDMFGMVASSGAASELSFNWMIRRMARTRWYGLSAQDQAAFGAVLNKSGTSIFSDELLCPVDNFNCLTAWFAYVRRPVQ